MSKFLSFSQWQCQMIQTTKADDEVSCPVCHGEGTVIEECHECGHEREINCETCDTDGFVAFGKLEAKEQRSCFTFQKYISELIGDAAKLIRWSGKGDLYSVLCECGYGVCQILRTKDYALIDLSNRNTVVRAGHFMNSFFRNGECAAQGH